jgi:hypothetical protein
MNRDSCDRSNIGWEPLFESLFDNLLNGRTVKRPIRTMKRRLGKPIELTGGHRAVGSQIGKPQPITHF